jgi:protein subunit release factor B
MAAFFACTLERMALARSSRAAFVTLPRSAVASTQYQPSNMRRKSLSSLSMNNEEKMDVEPTWTHVPYDPAKASTAKHQNYRPQRRQFSAWQVPKTVNIPEDKLDLSFVRSSGSGGQNVNKLSTKVELRFHVLEADWIPLEVRERLSSQQANRINKEGYFSITSQESRTQGQNRKVALAKLKAIILEAWPRPKIRKERTGISKAEKERRKVFKKKRGEVKSNRKRIDW